MLRQSVPHFPPNSVEFDLPVERNEMEIYINLNNYFISLIGDRTRNQSRLQSHFLRHDWPLVIFIIENKTILCLCHPFRSTIHSSAVALFQIPSTSKITETGTISPDLSAT